jgi:hypothetical protein
MGGTAWFEFETQSDASEGWAVTESECLREIFRILYDAESGEGGDGVFEDFVSSPRPIRGSHIIQIVAEAGASPTDSYSLEVEAEGMSVILAENAAIGDISRGGCGFRSAGTSITPFAPVKIDIKRGSDPNSVKLKGKGVIPVAILGSGNFRVEEVDVNTLAFGPDGAAPAEKKTGKQRRKAKSYLEDANGDGLTHLVSQYRAQETGIAASDSQACLTGETVDGTLFERCDSVRIELKHWRRP